MNIAIIGGTGLIGVSLCKLLNQRGDKLLVISRNSSSAKIKNKFAHNYFQWDYKSSENLSEIIVNQDVVINLAGASIAGKRWNKKYMQEIKISRISTTNLIAEAIDKCKTKPDTFISASATGYYGDCGDSVIDESSPPGNDFLAKVCSEWENVSQKVLEYNVRLVNLRTGIVLTKEGGALKRMLLPYKLYLGGPLGNGKQWFPWIHINDEINAILFVIDNENITGPANLVSPNAVRMKELAKSLGNVLNRPSVFKVPTFVLRLAAGKIAYNLVQSQRVIPKNLINSGFNFQFDELEKALDNLLK